MCEPFSVPANPRQRAVCLDDLADDNAVLAGLLGGIHGFVGPLGDAGLRIVGAQVGHTGAEGNQQLFVFMQEEAFGQLPLQADDGLFGGIDRRVRHDDDELFSAKAGQGVLWTQRIADDGDR